MWSSWLKDAKKKANQAFIATSQVVSEGIKVASEKAKEISTNASDVMKEMITRRPDDMTYITNNIIAMGFPGWPKNPNPSIKYNTREIVAGYLEEHHKDHYMIFNLSDETYESILFGDHIISYDLMGMPAPSLGMVMKICIAMETWLGDNDKNVVVVHCLTGKGRTLTMCACLLAWLGWVESTSEALHLCCDRHGGRVDELTTPSQRRYVQYFGMLLDCVQPQKRALLLKSLRLSDVLLSSTCPSVQVEVFNCGTPVFSTRVTLEEGEEGAARCVEVSCGRVVRVCVWCVCKAQGNIIVRVREQRENRYVSVCRCMFHTGYIEGESFRLTKEQLDGACNDAKAPSTMTLELSVEEAKEEYVPNSAANRLEIYESLLLDKNSALWRELLHRKEGRGAVAPAPPKVEKSEDKMFSIDSEEEEEEEEVKHVVPTKDAGRDYMMELALLESSLAEVKQGGEEEKKESFTAAEEQSLDNIMQSLNMDSEDEGDAELPDNIDLDALAGSLSSDEEGDEGSVEARDFNAEFGL